MDRIDDRRGRVGVAAAYVAGYVLLDWVSYIHPIAPFAITPWNPPPGLSLAMLLALGLRYAPLLLLASVLAEIVVRDAGGSPGEVLGYAAILAGGYAATAAWLLRGARLDARFLTLRDLSVFTASVGVAAAAIASAYIAAHVVAGRFSWAAWPEYTLRFWVGDVIGIVVLTPLLMVHAVGSRRPKWRITGEGLLQAAAIVAVLLAVFRAGDEAAARYFYVLFLPLVWISVRHGFEGATVALLAMQLGLIVAMQLAGYASSSVLELQLLMLTLAVTGLFLGMAVSEWRRVRRELEGREAELQTVVSTAPDAILTVDDAGRIAALNDAGAAMLGPREALIGSPLSRFVSELPPNLADARAMPARATRTDGTSFPVEVSAGSSAFAGRRIDIAVVRDMSQRKAIEEQLREQERELNRAMRAAAAAEMASALAHELNQPLTAATSYVQACELMAQRSSEGQAKLSDTMAKAVAELKRAADVVRRLRDMYRGGPVRQQPADLAQICAGVVRALNDRLQRHAVTVVTDIPARLPPVKVDPLQLEMVVHNLLGNAIDSMTAAHCSERIITLSAHVRADGMVQLAVHDTGPGVHDSRVATLFQPFATSKAEGMGMGLAISRSLVEQHGGRLWLESSCSGATFALALPADEVKA